MRTATRVVGIIAAGLLAACTAGGCAAVSATPSDRGLPGDDFLKDAAGPTPFDTVGTPDLDSGGFINGGGF